MSNISSVIKLFFQADIIVQCIMMSLLICSVWSWKIIFEKWWLIRLYGKDVVIADHLLHRKWDNIEDLINSIKQKRITIPTMSNTLDSIQSEYINYRINNSSSGKDSSNYIRERISQQMHIDFNKQTSSLESGLSFLAIVSGATPFIGLFGTVWGIMISFQAIASSNNATLSVVAPGIAEALLATGCGLVAAIPALIAYNKFTSSINRIATNIENIHIAVDNLLLKSISDNQ